MQGVNGKHLSCHSRMLNGKDSLLMTKGSFNESTNKMYTELSICNNFDQRIFRYIMLSVEIWYKYFTLENSVSSKFSE